MILILLLLLVFSYRTTKSDLKTKLFTCGYVGLFQLMLPLYTWQILDLPLANKQIWLFFSTNYWLNTFIALLYGLILANCVFLFNSAKKRGIITRTKKYTWYNWLFLGLSFLLIFIGFLAFSSSQWAMTYFGNIRVDQIIYTLSQPLQGTDTTQVTDYLTNPLLLSFLLSLFFTSLLYFFSTHRIQISSKTHFPFRAKGLNSGTVVACSVLFLTLGISLGVQTLGYADIKAYFFETTSIYDDYYVDPESVNLTFPTKKRNLIYIYMESMESSYSSTDNGGIEENNLIPNLTNLALNEGVNFSNRDSLGGMMQIPGANQTASSLVAQTSGIPLRVTTGSDVNNYSKNGQSYLPGAYSLGEVLEKEGYQRSFLLGSDSAFASRDKYFTQHGDYDILDYNWAKETGKIDEDYHVWWGYEDEKLFDYAKDTVTELANNDAPFDFTMLTADTHFEDGYMESDTPNLFDDQYSNVIHFSDQQTMDFINWVKDQDFYDNTTIIICGDHLTMDSDFFEDIDPNYQRSVYNVILNGAQTETEYTTTNRLFSAVDMYPTTLAALGVDIPGDRLGIGTNLFSDKETVMEELGYDTFYNEVSKRSNFYQSKIIKGTDLTSSE